MYKIALAVAALTFCRCLFVSTDAHRRILDLADLANAYRQSSTCLSTLCTADRSGLSRCVDVNWLQQHTSVIQRAAAVAAGCC